ncbi:MAG: VOC family protein [Peptostreptococcaceae bacterium]|nr:VOC family protein [Peptostreptococcaceae bacterium]
MKAKLEHIAIAVKSPIATAEWFNKYFEFVYYDGDVLGEGIPKDNTRTIIKNPNGDMLEIFSSDTSQYSKNGPITHLAFVVDNLDDCYRILTEDRQIDSTSQIIRAKGFNLLFITTFDGITIELLQRFN